MIEFGIVTELTARADKINCRELILSLLQLDQLKQARLAIETAEKLTRQAVDCHILEHVHLFIAEGRFITAERIIEQMAQQQ